MERNIRKIRPRNGFLKELQHDILQLIAQKKTLRRRRWKSRDKQNAATHGALIRNLHKIIKYRIRLFEDRQFLELLHNIPPNQNMFRKVNAYSEVRARQRIGDFR